MNNRIKFLLGLNLGFMSFLIGEWSNDIKTLIVFMCVDYIVGTLNSFVYKTSPKTENGGLSSRVGLEGIIKKLFLLFLIIVAHQLDLVLNVTYIRTGVCLTLIGNELVSIMETYTLSGLKTPKIIENAIDLLKDGDSYKNK